jgi:hypothetical protein
MISKRALLRMVSTFLSALLFTLSLHAADKETLLYNFRKSSGGALPAGGLVMDSAGNLYGATSEGGTSTSCGSYGCGTIFEMSPNGSGGYTYNVLYNFNSFDSDSIPLGSMVMDAAGNLYGATSGFSRGEIFELSPNGSGGWTETVLYTFSNDGIGSTPIVLDKKGNISGASSYGGASNDGFVIELTPGANGWTLNQLHDFGGPDGNFPVAGVILDPLGNVYGTTQLGGTSTNCTNGCGLVYEMEHTANGWQELVLLQFDGSNGSLPQAPLLMDAAGDLFGTASAGGSKGYGIVFKLKRVGETWQPSILHNFTQANGDGAAPNTALILDGSGNLYGTTTSGGGGLGDCFSDGDTGCGSAFELSFSNGTWKEKILHDFTGANDGGFPGGVILDPSGNLYGPARAGGTHAYGNGFELSPQGAK